MLKKEIKKFQDWHQTLMDSLLAHFPSFHYVTWKCIQCILRNPAEKQNKQTGGKTTRVTTERYTYTESSLSSWGHYAEFNMALYTLSYGLTEAWEIPDHLTLTLSDLNQHTGAVDNATATNINSRDGNGSLSCPELRSFLRQIRLCILSHKSTKKFTAVDLKSIRPLPSAGSLVGVSGVDVILLLALLCVEGSVAPDVLPGGSEVAPDVLCCAAVAVAGVVVCVRWPDVALATSVMRRHRGSRLWEEKTSGSIFLCRKTEMWYVEKFNLN